MRRQLATQLNEGLFGDQDDSTELPCDVLVLFKAWDLLGESERMASNLMMGGTSELDQHKSAAQVFCVCKHVLARF